MVEEKLRRFSFLNFSSTTLPQVQIYFQTQKCGVWLKKWQVTAVLKVILAEK